MLKMGTKNISLFFFILIFLTPYIGIGNYGVTLLEIVAFLFLFILPLISQGKVIKLPNILIAFFICIINILGVSNSGHMQKIFIIFSTQK